ncbi:MAG: DEAD/DEAH box helicase [Rhodospirillales bacterium]
MTFEDLGLSPAVLQAVTDAGYSEPTPIQAQAIPYVLMGRDVLGCAQTGTGKTAGFTLPMIDILASGRAKARMPRSLILEPTRELAAQVSENFEVYGKHNKLSMALLIGGVSFGDQEKKLDRGVDVLIATPGRLLDHIERGKVLLSDVKVLVIDEADRMLDMGFIPDIERIVSLLPKIRQTLFFSATMPPEIRKLADKFLMNPKEVSVSKPATAATTVKQGLAIVRDDDKREALRRLIASEDVQNALIFCNRKRDVDILYKSLKRHGFSVGALHGDMSQPARTETLERFKNNEIKLLCASDVAARGLDVDNLSHVFNFDVPIHSEDYVHRIGRTGRAGKTGVAYTLASPDDGRFVAAIEQMLGMAIPRIEVPELVAEFSAEEDGDRRRGRGRGRPGQGAKPSGGTSRGGRGNGRGGNSRSRTNNESHSDNRDAPAPAMQADAAPTNTAEEVLTPVPGTTIEIPAIPEIVPQAAPEAVPQAAEHSQDRPQERHDERQPQRRERQPRNDQRQQRTDQRPDQRNDQRGEQRGDQRSEPRDYQRNNDQRAESREPRRDYGHGNGGNDRRRPQRDNDSGPSVVGMGDHMPAFLARPTRER